MSDLWSGAEDNQIPCAVQDLILDSMLLLFYIFILYFHHCVDLCNMVATEWGRRAQVHVQILSSTVLGSSICRFF